MEIVNGLGGAAGFGEDALPRTDDTPSVFVALTSVFTNGLEFFGERYTGVYINTNGSVTFDDPLWTFTPETISSNTSPGIFPFWADVDTRGGPTNASPGGVSQGTNLVHYDVDADAKTLTVTWDDVGYYNSRTDKVNTLQLVLADLSDVPGYTPGDFSFSFAYENIEWTTGDESGGENGLGGTPARLGYSSGNGSENYFELPQSGDEAALMALVNAPEILFLPDGSDDFMAVVDDHADGWATTC